MKKAIIFAGGKISGFKQNKNNEDIFIIAVDKGNEYCLKNDISIDISLGDYDSISKKYLEKLENKNIKKLKYDVNKNFSDLELAYLYCLEENILEIIVYGALGSRLDHSLTNVQLLKTYYKKGLKIKLINKKNEIFYTDHSVEVKNRKSYISILATDEKSNISLKNVKWELENHDLKYGSSLTVSNRFIENQNANIIINKGDCFIILSND